MFTTNDTEWFALRATYGRNMIVKQRLDDMGVESFVPMRNTTVTQRGRRTHRLVPVIRDLIFVHTSAENMRQIKSRIDFLHYITRPEGGRNVPIIVPESQMSHFIAVAGTCDDKLIYLAPEQVNLKAGQRVRIHGGSFDGQVGHFVKVAGARSRRVVVAVEGIIAVARVVADIEQLEAID